MFQLFLILGIIAFLIALPFATKDKRVFVLWMSGLVIWIVGLMAFRSFACGPNSHDVKIMKPQAKAITEYIIKNGIPKSLEEIPDLHYELMGCERKVQYEAAYYEVLKSQEGADYAVIEEKCMFLNQKKTYNLRLWFVKHYKSLSSSHGNIYLSNKATETTVEYSIDSDEKGIYLIGKNNPRIDGSNSFGICASFGRQ